MPTKNVGGVKVEVPCDKRFTIYRGHLYTIKDRLKGIRDNKDVDAQGDVRPTAVAKFTVGPAKLAGHITQAYRQQLLARADLGDGHNLVRKPFSKDKRTGGLKKLLNQLAGDLDTWVALGVAADLNWPQTMGNLNQAQIKFLKDMQDNMNAGLQGVRYGNYFSGQNPGSSPANFFARHPGIELVLNKIRDYSTRNLRECCERLIANWGDITNAFFPGKILLELAKITLTGSDYHKGGKQVLILTFNTKSWDDPRRQVAGCLGTRLVGDDPVEQRRLVYKPTDLDVDCRLLGKTAIFHGASQVRPNGYQIPLHGSLLEKIQQKLQACGNHLTLPTYKILPYHAHTAPPPAPGFRDPYGYIEYLTFKPEPPAHAEGANDTEEMIRVATKHIRKHGGMIGTSSDYILSPEGVPAAAARRIENYFRTYGRLMAVCHTFCISDMHFENVRVHEGVPHLIDVEDCLKWPIAKLQDIGMIYRGGPLADYANRCRGGGNKLRVMNDKTDQITVGWAPDEGWIACQAYEYAQNPATNHWQVSKVNREYFTSYVRHIVTGFAEVMEAIAANQADFLGLVDDMQQSYARFVPVPTTSYYHRLVAWHLYPRNRRVTKRGEFDRACSGPACGGPGVGCAHCNVAHNDQGREPLPSPEFVAVRDALAHWADEAKGPRITKFTLANNWPYDAWSHHASFLLACGDHDFADYANFDIPAYYHRLGSQDLSNSQGNQVSVRRGVGTPWEYQAGLGHEFTGFDLSANVVNQAPDQAQGKLFRNGTINVLSGLAAGPAPAGDPDPAAPWPPAQNNGHYFPQSARDLVRARIQALSNRDTFRRIVGTLLNELLYISVNRDIETFQLTIPAHGGDKTYRYDPYAHAAFPPAAPAAPAARRAWLKARLNFPFEDPRNIWSHRFWEIPL